MITIAVDCMGGDHGPGVTLPACGHFLDRHPDVNLLLVGLPDSLSHFSHVRAKTIFANQVVGMDDTLEVALRRKKDSSMRVAIQQVKEGVAQAAVSAGNTAALMAISRYLLKTLDGIDRPAIAAQVPNAKGQGTMVLDMGANVDCSAEHLLQFSVMGSALVSALSGNDNPSVGLLNIGEEAIKGNEVIKKAGELLRSASKAGDLNFYGIFSQEWPPLRPIQSFQHSRSAWTIAATTVVPCWACAAWSSKAMAQPTQWRSSCILYT